MVKYSCERCGWKTNIKTHLRNHLKRKFPCKPTLKNVSQKTLLDKLANVSMHVSIIKKNVSLNVNPVSLNVNPVSPNVSIIRKNVSPNVSIIRKNVSPNVSPNVSLKTYNEHKIYVCSKCNKTFKHRQSKYRHEKKNICAQIILTDSTKEELLQELDNIKKEKEQQSKFITEMQETHMREIGGLLKKVGDTINNNTYIKEQNIIINNYGQENVEYLSESYLKKLLHIHPSVAINLLIKNIHCHPKHPENHNIKITNKKLPYASIYKDGDWIVQDKKKVIKDIVSTSYNMIDENYSESMNINKNKKDTYEKFQKQYENKDKHLHKDLEKTAEILIMNNSNK
jgi:DNA-directed RNA polymerase subunit RPC12/RpoP